MHISMYRLTTEKKEEEIHLNNSPLHAVIASL